MEIILDLIKNRRTTRVYKEEMISEEELEKIIEAGMWAPSGHNRQPWHFTIIENKEISDTDLSEIILKAKDLISKGTGISIDKISIQINFGSNG